MERDMKVGIRNEQGAFTALKGTTTSANDKLMYL